MQEEQFIQESWNKQRIFITVTLVASVVGISYGAKTLLLDKNKQVQVESVVEGVKTQNTERVQTSDQEDNTPATFSLPKTEDLKANITQRIETIQTQIASLDAKEIASSSPQVQKILQDLKALEEYPKSQAKQMCENVCKNF